MKRGGCDFCGSNRHNSANHGTHCYTHGEPRRNMAAVERRVSRKVRRARLHLEARRRNVATVVQSAAYKAAHRPGSLKP